MYTTPWKTVAGGLVASLVFGATALAADFNDVSGYWAEPYVSGLADRNFIGGFPDGTFRPSAPITRAQFAAIAAKAFNLQGSGGNANFNDVTRNYWAANAIAAVSDNGLVTGFPDGTFRPEERITRAQALVILTKALGNRYKGSSQALDKYNDVQAVPDWARTSIEKAADAGIIANFPDPAVIAPNKLASRGEVAALMYQTLARSGQNLPPLSIGLIGGGQGGADRGGALSIERIALSPNKPSLQPGEVLNIRVSASPGATGNFSIQGVAQSLPLQETDSGVYEGNYTVKRGDQENNARIAVTLRNRNDSITQEADRRLSFGAAPTRPDFLEGKLVRGSSSTIYKVENGRRRAIPNPQTLQALGYSFDQVVKLPDNQLNTIPLGQPVPSQPFFADGALVRGSGPTIYQIENGRRRAIPDPQTLQALGYNFNQVKKISDSQLNAIPLGAPVPPSR
ncbi:S-layer homology domain-containing protein [Gloeobacter kilaueensis]|uniref:SLH domain-containing protein n=1 Tax=Gloeobacter kilaueensis (strain ATCC BAA-2537 / CCAP 1431/1 / ULC 316 / JS1) TaxID=1183438 RepID=U5QI73_GLOK1|nr:S-layer homology domain-containing protein [Gloeobacter kilaueensis]AGY57335.1 hypothetical protein GKIL_1089 [Gloeobacter kilaueensis JS1]